MTERAPCPACAEPIAREARLCPHCRVPVLFGVRLSAPVSDPRSRYRLARELSALGGERRLATLQTALGTAGSSVATGLTRAEAERWVAALGGDSAASLVWAGTGSSAPWAGRQAALLGVAAAVAVVALAGTLALRGRGERTRPAPQPVVAARISTAEARPLAPAGAPRMSSRDLAKAALPSTVSLRCADGVGAGFFVTEDTVLTNAHVRCGDGGAMKVIFSDGREAAGEPLRSDPTLDLALVKVQGATAPPLALGDAGAVQVGDRVMLIGSPIGMEFTVHEGMVSNVGRPHDGVAYIQIDAKVNPGNSGGPLLDEEGRVIGVVSLKLMRAEGIGLAIPINYAFSGAGALLPYPSPGPDPGRFDALRAQASWANLSPEAAEPRPAERKPALVGGYIDQYRRVVARVLRPAASMPGFQEVAFKFWMNGREVCALKGDVREWKLVDRAADSRLAGWADGMGDVRAFVGEAPLRLEGCGSGVITAGVEMELQDADPRSPRIRLY
jgi:S1-C subfamily serine protease